MSGLKSSLGFLTVLPIGMNNESISLAARYMPIFPLIGAFVGATAGVLIWVLSYFLPSLLVGVIGFGFLLFFNGCQHFDGLLDFGDGIMCHGSRRRKLQVMRDPQTGAGGFALGSVVLLASVVTLSSLVNSHPVQSLAVAEAAASFSMVFETGVGRSAHEGMNSLFVQAMRTARPMRLGLTFLLLLVPAVVFFRTTGLLVCTVAIGTSLVMVVLATRAFGGITGDVLGATNEVTRLTTLIAVLVSVKWL